MFFLETGLACLYLVSKTASNPKEPDLRKEQDLDSNRETRMENNDQDQENLARLRIRSTQNRVQIPKQEENRPAEANTHKRPVERRERAPAHQRNSDPNQIGITVQRPAFDQVRGGATEPAQRTPQSDGDDARVPVHQPSGTREKREIVLEMLVVVV